MTLCQFVVYSLFVEPLSQILRWNIDRKINTRWLKKKYKFVYIKGWFIVRTKKNPDKLDFIGPYWGSEIIEYVSEDRGSPFYIVQNYLKKRKQKQQKQSDLVTWHKNGYVGKVLS